MSPQVTPPLTLNVTDLGELTVMPYEEPAARVEFFASEVARAGVVNVDLGATMRTMLEWFCGRRSCFRGIREGALTLAVEPLGNLTVRAWEEPAEMVELFAAQANGAGAERGAARVASLGARREARHSRHEARSRRTSEGPARRLGRQTMDDMMAWFCAKRPCRRNITGPVRLRVEGVGNLTVRPFQDPTAVVEKFAAAATEAGYAMGAQGMVEMLTYVCERRSCFRPITGPLRVAVEGVGNLTVLSHEEPAARVEAFAAAAAAQGVPLSDEMLTQMMEYFCTRRSCHRPVRPALQLNIPELGSLVVQPSEEPADAVERFALAVLQQSGVQWLNQ